MRLEDLLRGMALTHQVAIQAAKGWGEINLAMDLLPLGAHQITLALTLGSSTKDHCVSRGVTAMGTTNTGTTQTGQLFTSGILNGTNMEPLKHVVDKVIHLLAEIAIAEFSNSTLSIKEIK